KGKKQRLRIYKVCCCSENMAGFRVSPSPPQESADEREDRSASHRSMTLPRIHFGRPQRLAALLLLAFLAQCLWVVGHQQLSTADYRFARCGREMWERPSPLAGTFT